LELSEREVLPAGNAGKEKRDDARLAVPMALESDSHLEAPAVV
jgi:hypothetical protein